MSNGTLLIILGVLVALTPFSGLPGYILEFLLPTLGIMVVVIGYLLRPRRTSNPTDSTSVVA